MIAASTTPAKATARPLPGRGAGSMPMLQRAPAPQIAKPVVAAPATTPAPLHTFNTPSFYKALGALTPFYQNFFKSYGIGG